MPESRKFPGALLEWAGHHSGGVRRLFDQNSGRPNKDVLRTNLLSRLEAWTQQLVTGISPPPRILLLVGGPGNGKTEAIESTINWLDEAFGCKGDLVKELARTFLPQDGGAVPRIVHVDASALCTLSRPLELSIVQDASVIFGCEGRTSARLLIEELCSALDGPSSKVYLCCVNRGILDDALIHALENDLRKPQLLLEAITRAVSLAPSSPPCWPLDGFPSIAVWPMDAESLLVQTNDNSEPPASIVVSHAIAEERWPALNSCPAGDKCPFCSSRTILSREGPRTALLSTLRWFELGSGKRWNFRDLFSLISYLLAGHRPAEQEKHDDPCLWAARLVELDAEAVGSRKPGKLRSKAIFQLATSSYQHALFHRWDREISISLRKDIKELDLENDHTLMGLYYFLHDRRAQYLPATIASLLEDVVDLLDPALASPDSEVAVSLRSKVLLRDIDARFSRSTDDGIEFLRKYQALSASELELLKRIASIDSKLSLPSFRRNRPSAASRVQRTLRDFACRLVRRSLGARSAVVLDSDILRSFQQVVENDDKSDQLYEVAQQVEDLLNKGEYFEVSLTTTFGQPLPPQQRQATLVVPRRQVGILEASHEGRPHSPICFLMVGSGNSAQPIALTYDLFKAVKELERGMSLASLPRTVVALLDTTRARLSGPIVRDDEVLGRSKIRIGTTGTIIARHRGSFVSRNEGTRV